MAFALHDQITPSRPSPRAIDFVARNEFDFTIKAVAEGQPLAEVHGLSYKVDGRAVHNPERAILHDMDLLPFVTPIYHRDLVLTDYFIGYLKHPYVSLYTGRGCKSRCTFCLWPQTIGGHTYRTRSPAHVIEEIAQAKESFPQVKEFFFDDDTFNIRFYREADVRSQLEDHGFTWGSCKRFRVETELPTDFLRIHMTRTVS